MRHHFQKSVLINPGDTRERVIEIMGPPGDRQFRDKTKHGNMARPARASATTILEIVWFYDGKVTGLTSYKDRTPASVAAAHFKPIRWKMRPMLLLKCARDNCAHFKASHRAGQVVRDDNTTDPYACMDTPDTNHPAFFG